MHRYERELGIFILTCLLVTNAEYVEHKLGGLSGEIKSPKFKNTYPPYLNISWNIVVKEGARIELEFTEFDIEDSYDQELGGSCVYDYVQIVEDDWHTHTYCGNSKTNQIEAPLIGNKYVSKGNSIRVNFVSDYSNEDPIPKGFVAKYTELDRDECMELLIKAYTTIEDWDTVLYCNHQCHNIPSSYYCSCDPGFKLHENKHTCTNDCAGKILTDLEGEITTSRYPKEYSKLAECDWTIKQSVGISIEIQFMDKFEIEEHDDEGCVYDWVQYEDARGIKSKKYCGSNLPEKGKWIATNSNVVKVFFRSDLTIEEAGFKLRYRTTRTTLFCKRKLIPPTNGKITLGSKGVVTFECDIGYKVIGSKELQCLKTGKWSGNEPKCEKVACPKKLVPPENGNIVTTIKDFVFGDIVTFECPIGYRMLGEKKLQCLSTGKWSAKEPKCQDWTIFTPCSQSCNGGYRSNIIKECSALQFFTKGCVKNYEDCNTDPCSEIVCPDKQKHRYTGKSLCCEASSESCGNPGKIVSRQRVIGGEKSAVGEWPWAAVMVTRDTKTTHCGGSLIHKDWVLTAAHCIASYEKKDYYVLLGSTTIRYPKSTKQIIDIEKFIPHSEYGDPENDIGLVQLKKSAKITKTVTPICLPSGETVSMDEKCVAAGWGIARPEDIDADIASDALQHVVLRNLPHDACVSGYNDISWRIAYYDKETNLCFGILAGGKDTCSGDSGGPIMCQRCSSCGWYIAGVTSYGATRCGAPKQPGVYMNVKEYEDWIKKKVTGIPFHQDFSSCHSQ